MEKTTKDKSEFPINQTAVEWLTEQLGINVGSFRERAIAIEKEQLMFAYNKGATDMSENEYNGMENYYNKTYGKEETK